MKTAHTTANTKRNKSLSQPANLCSRCGIALTLGVLGLTGVSSVFGEGFRDSPAGAFDLSRAGGRIAQVDDSTAVTQNPANMVDVAGTQLNFAPTVIYLHADFTSTTGLSDDTKHPWKVLPNFFATKSFQDGTYAIGLGITVPYGIANEWNTDLGGPFKPVAGPAAAPYFTELQTINVSPAFAYKVTDYLKVGVGLDVMYSHLRFNQFFNGSPSIEGEAAGHGFGYGGNLGLTWQVTDHQRIAATYRSPMTVNYQGKFNVRGFGPYNSSSSFNSQINFPTIASIGYGIDLTDKIRLASDLEYIQFSRFQDLPVNVGANPLTPSLSIAEHWHDTFTIGISADWKFADGWTVRGGYQYYESPIPDNTFTPSIPDANQNVITMGLNYTHNRHSLEFGYGLDFYDHRNISNDQNAALNGSYKFDVHLFSFSYRYSF